MRTEAVAPTKGQMRDPKGIADDYARITLDPWGFHQEGDDLVVHQTYQEGGVTKTRDLFHIPPLPHGAQRAIAQLAANAPAMFRALAASHLVAGQFHTEECEADPAGDYTDTCAACQVQVPINLVMQEILGVNLDLDTLEKALEP